MNRLDRKNEEIKFKNYDTGNFHAGKICNLLSKDHFFWARLD